MHQVRFDVKNYTWQLFISMINDRELRSGTGDQYRILAHIACYYFHLELYTYLDLYLLGFQDFLVYTLIWIYTAYVFQDFSGLYSYSDLYHY